MEPIDRRITAARLMALRSDPNAVAEISHLLGVDTMAPLLGARTRRDIEKFAATGDAILAAQLIHASIVRRRLARLQRQARRI